METEDLLKRQIDQLGKVLKYIISKILDLDTGGNVAETTQAVNVQLENELKISISDLVKLDKTTLIEFLNKSSLNADNLHQLGKLLNALAKVNDEGKTGIETANLIAAARVINDHVGNLFKTVYFDTATLDAKY